MTLRQLIEFMFIGKGAIVFTFLACAVCVRAEVKKPCLIFQGDAVENLSIDLDRYNRIKFGDESMVLSSSENPGTTLELLYTAYNQFLVGDSNPNSAMEDITAVDVRLIYNAAEQTLALMGVSEEIYSVGIFNLSGVLLRSTSLTAGEAVSVQSLGSGVYVAVALNSTNSQTIKFVK